MSTVLECKKVNTESGLRAQCLPFSGVLAQSIANIAPSAAPALFIPSVFAISGNGTWLTFILSTIAIVLIGYNINHFASKSASPGALYTYASKELGPYVGMISGWGLLLAYVLTASAVVCGFANYGNVLLEVMGINGSPIVLVTVGVLSSWFIAFKDIKLSAKMMLLFEAISVLCILLLAGVILVKHGFNFDLQQLTLQDVSPDSIKSGLVLAIFSYVGFESATALGDEAKNPLRTIPKAVISSGLAVGIFFIVLSYTEIMGFIGNSVKFNEAEAPLVMLAQNNGLGFMSVILSLGALISFWACVTASINAGSRVLFTMARHNIFHPSLGNVHENNETPYIAVTIISIIVLTPTIILLAYGNKLFDIFNWLATIATFGFLLNYLLIVIAAPVYLYREKRLKVQHIGLALISIIILLITIVGSVYPLPAYPFCLFPFIFIAWIILGGLWFAIISIRKSSLVADIKKENQLSHDKFKNLRLMELVGEKK